MKLFSEPTTVKKLPYRTIHEFTATSLAHRIKLAWVIFWGSIWMLRSGEIVAWTEWTAPTEDENARLRAALAPILNHADSHDYAPPIRLSVRQCREIKEMVNG